MMHLRLQTRRGILILLLTLSFSAMALTNNPPTPRSSIQWNPQERAFVIGDTHIKIRYHMACGYFDDQAEYASFGLERQIYKCSKITIPITLSRNHLFGYLNLAPLYDSIKSVNSGNTNPYGPDSKKRMINGHNPYNDWYKNLGTRIYYLGQYPIIQAYVGYQFNIHNQIIAGRIINTTGLDDDQTPWDDDGKFSPYAYWLSRDLYSGIAYRFNSQFIGARAVFLSGNNPMKGYANYLDHIQSPNIKGNNTPSYGLDAHINIGHWLSSNNTSQLSAGLLLNTMSSTWSDIGKLEDGKRRNSVYATSLTLNWPINSQWSIDFFGQYTWYLSGLDPKSGQKVPDKLTRAITQSGYFAGVTLRYRMLAISYTHENFDRFDFNIYQHWVDRTRKSYHFGPYTTLAQLEKLQQSSDIINIKYQMNTYVDLDIDYQHINNPVEWVSDILDTRPDYRFGALINVHF